MNICDNIFFLQCNDHVQLGIVRSLSTWKENNKMLPEIIIIG